MKEVSRLLRQFDQISKEIDKMSSENSDRFGPALKRAQIACKIAEVLLNDNYEE